MPLIGRLYLPADLGRLGTFLAYLGTAGVVTGLRYDIMIVAAATEAESAALLAGVCWVTGPLSLMASGVLAWLIHAKLLGFEVLPMSAALWMFPALVVTQLAFTLRYWLMRAQMFPEIARVTVWQNVARAAAPVCLFPLQGGWVGLVAGEVVGRCAGLGTLIRSNGVALRKALSALAPGDIGRAFRRYPESPAAGMPSALIDTAGTLLPLPLIAGLFGATSAGYFALVQRAMQLPLGLISRNVADVFHARLAQRARESTEAARTLFWRTTLFLLVVGGIPSVLGIFFAPRLLTFIMGSRWAPTGQLLVAMIPWSLAMFVVSPLSRVVVVYRGQVFKLIYDGISLAAVGLVIWLAQRAGWTLLQTVWVLSWSQAATYLIYFGVLLRMLYREAPELYADVDRAIG
ncbi:MAG TPA: hypothetical protein VJN95_15405 [Gemmatimonadales bacterium]|nr:hypothetical protein [Gemmatimonadales bacterium]